MAKQFRLAATAQHLGSILRSPGRYASVGLLCAALNIGCVIVLDRAGFHYAPAMVIAFVGVTLVAYTLHAAFTFRASASAAGLLRFVGASATAFPLALLLMFLLCDGVGLSVSAALPIATAILFVWNYLGSKWAITGRGVGPSV